MKKILIKEIQEFDFLNNIVFSTKIIKDCKQILELNNPELTKEVANFLIRGIENNWSESIFIKINESNS